MFRGLICIAVCSLASGCASSQLNYNAADLASSLNSLTKKQIFFNLAQAINDPEFVPSQVTISIGTAQTANAITPSISVPLGPPIATTSRFTNAANPSAQFSTLVTNAAPGLGVQVTDAWNQSWTMVPANSSNESVAYPLSIRHGSDAARRHDQGPDPGRSREAVLMRLSHAGHGSFGFARGKCHLQAGGLPG